MKIIYAQNNVKVEEEGFIHNPDYYDVPNKNAKSVLIFGDFPKIKADYEELEIPVSLAIQKTDVSKVEAPKSPNDALTVPQIKEKLEALKIEFAKSGKKDELLILLDAAEVNQNQQNNQGDDQNQGTDQSQDENKQPE